MQRVGPTSNAATVSPVETGGTGEEQLRAGAGAQVSAQAIDATVGALAPALDVGRLFRGVPPGAPHALRCIICYRGHHYCALALSEELQRWLLFDDARVRPPPPAVLRCPAVLLAVPAAQGCRASSAFVPGRRGGRASRLTCCGTRARPSSHHTLLRATCRGPSAPPVVCTDARRARRCGWWAVIGYRVGTRALTRAARAGAAGRPL